MLSNIFLKSLRDQRRPMFWWEVGIIVVSLITCATYPSFKDNTQLDDILGDSEFLKALAGGFESMSSGEGFVNTQLLAVFMPVLVMIFVIRLGTNTIAGEERDGTIDVLMANPVSRVSALARPTRRTRRHHRPVRPAVLRQRPGSASHNSRAAPASGGPAGGL